LQSVCHRSASSVGVYAVSDLGVAPGAAAGARSLASVGWRRRHGSPHTHTFAHLSVSLCLLLSHGVPSLRSSVLGTRSKPPNGFRSHPMAAQIEGTQRLLLQRRRMMSLPIATRRRPRYARPIGARASVSSLRCGALRPRHEARRFVCGARKALRNDRNVSVNRQETEDISARPTIADSSSGSPRTARTAAPARPARSSTKRSAFTSAPAAAASPSATALARRRGGGCTNAIASTFR
jgi:hypothetical protein